MEFTKMHGIGNDFVMIDNCVGKLPDHLLPALARSWCDRHFGVGADGLILVEPSRQAHFRMRMFNPDGSESEMCGNGIRCFAKYVYDRRLHQDLFLKVETGAGVKELRITVRDRKVEAVRVDMGRPVLERAQIPLRGEGRSPVLREKLQVGGRKFEITCVSMGNPHCTVFVDDVQKFPVEVFGPQIENHRMFPNRVNVEFIQPVGKSEIRMRVWERGAGETLACGTGACAATVASALNGRTDRKVTLQLKGGTLGVEWLGDDHVYMTGPVSEVFSGQLDPASAWKPDGLGLKEGHAVLT